MIPRVSVLLPVRDASATLPECLASLAAQLLDDHEVIAVDDGSRDGSAELLAAAARADARVRVVTQAATGHGGGPQPRPDARARSPPRAHGRRTTWRIRSGSRCRRVRLDDEPALMALGSRVRLVGSPGARNDGMRAYVEWQEPGAASGRHRARALRGVAARPSVGDDALGRALRALGGSPRDGRPRGLRPVAARAAAAGWRFAKLPEVLLDWRDAPDRLTRTDPRYHADRFRAAKLDALAAGPLAGWRAAVVWGAGKVGKAWSRDLRARGHGVAAFVEVDPRRKIGQRIHGAPVVDVAQAASVEGAPLHLAAVGSAEARERIRNEAARLGLVEGRDFVAVA